MILGKAFEKFADGSPVCVMNRGSLEYALSEGFVNDIFPSTALPQDTRDLLFPDVVDVTGGVVCQVFPSSYAGCPWVPAAAGALGKVFPLPSQEPLTIRQKRTPNIFVLDENKIE